MQFSNPLGFVNVCLLNLLHENGNHIIPALKGLRLTTKINCFDIPMVIEFIWLEWHGRQVFSSKFYLFGFL